MTTQREHGPGSHLRRTAVGRLAAILAALTGLSIAIVGAYHGEPLRTVTEITATPPSGSPNLSAGVAQLYTFATDCTAAEVSTDPDIGYKVYGVWNATAATAAAVAAETAFILAPGQKEPSPPGMSIHSVALYCASGLTKGTDFKIKGVPGSAN